jgi:hypothetical protein
LSAELSSIGAKGRGRGVGDIDDRLFQRRPAERIEVLVLCALRGDGLGLGRGESGVGGRVDMLAVLAIEVRRGEAGEELVALGWVHSFKVTARFWVHMCAFIC